MDRNLDQKIIDKLKSGNDEAYRKFYLATLSPFKAWCQREYRLNDEASNDLYQESHMYLYENIMAGKLDGLTSQLSTYLYSIAKNQLLIKYKKEGVIQKHETKLCEHLVFLKGAEDAIAQKETLAIKVKKEIERMLDPCKTLLQLFYYESLSFKQIVERMKYKNESVAKNQKKRCLDRLRENTKS
jgi:RNA polymerase sigma-70 factor (ECF subfamily)